MTVTFSIVNQLKTDLITINIDKEDTFTFVNINSPNNGNITLTIDELKYLTYEVKYYLDNNITHSTYPDKERLRIDNILDNK